MSTLNFDCKKCTENFNCDVGNITFNFTRTNNRPTFEKDIECPSCGTLTMDDVWLTELGQGQLTAIHLNS